MRSKKYYVAIIMCLVSLTVVTYFLLKNTHFDVEAQRSSWLPGGITTTPTIPPSQQSTPIPSLQPQQELEYFCHPDFDQIVPDICLDNGFGRCL